MHFKILQKVALLRPFNCWGAMIGLRREFAAFQSKIEMHQKMYFDSNLIIDNKSMITSALFERR